MSSPWDQSPDRLKIHDHVNISLTWHGWHALTFTAAWHSLGLVLTLYKKEGKKETSSHNPLGFKPTDLRICLWRDRPGDFIRDISLLLCSAKQDKKKKRKKKKAEMWDIPLQHISFVCSSLQLKWIEMERKRLPMKGVERCLSDTLCSIKARRRLEGETESSLWFWNIHTKIFQNF